MDAVKLVHPHLRNLKICFYFTLFVGEQDKSVQTLTVEGEAEEKGVYIRHNAKKYFFLPRRIDGCLVTPQ
jgi:hypothetical protein